MKARSLDTHPPNRWYGLRHPEGFSDPLFACFRAQCRVWRAAVDAEISLWPLLSDPNTEKPVYEWGAIERWADHSVVTVALGGVPGTVGQKLFEDEAPRRLFELFPGWFQLGLEWGRCDTLGWYPEWRWWPVFPPEVVERLRRQDAYQRPHTLRPR